jgi:HAD superfamily hydrolase (TIGR01459 family)
MTTAIENLVQIAGRFDAIVLDQWGVLHDGSAPYPGAIAALLSLKAGGTRLGVLSNSGKRAGPNIARIAAMGFPAALFDVVMTSGEALWRDIHTGRIPARRLYPIEGSVGDARAWAQGLDVTLVESPGDAEAILLMGLPDDTPLHSLPQGLPVFCTNPDRASPRAGGNVTSPGAVAHAHAQQGGDVRFYGKPHLSVFRAVETALALPPARLVMVGDSLEHDIAGANGAGWASVFIQGGLHRRDFSGAAPAPQTLARLVKHAGAAPTYCLQTLG